ncbi:MAG: hypothetical protein OEM32_09335, partial [Acidimicrobiia bacterium]|nr:hypothetical protein [Acidimicrobiia bacterium]
MAEPFTHNLVHFTRYLRAQGLRVVPETTASLIDAADVVGMENRNDAYFAFRALTITRPDDIPVFDAAFDLFFGVGGRVAPIDPRDVELFPTAPQARVLVPTVSRTTRNGDGSSDVSEQIGASAIERLGMRDFSELTRSEYAE